MTLTAMPVTISFPSDRLTGGTTNDNLPVENPSWGGARASTQRRLLTNDCQSANNAIAEAELNDLSPRVPNRRQTIVCTDREGCDQSRESSKRMSLAQCALTAISVDQDIQHSEWRRISFDGNVIKGRTDSIRSSRRHHSTAGRKPPFCPGTSSRSMGDAPTSFEPSKAQRGNKEEHSWQSETSNEFLQDHDFSGASSLTSEIRSPCNYSSGCNDSLPQVPRRRGTIITRMNRTNNDITEHIDWSKLSHIATLGLDTTAAAAQEVANPPSPVRRSSSFDDYRFVGKHEILDSIPKRPSRRGETSCSGDNASDLDCLCSEAAPAQERLVRPTIELSSARRKQPERRKLNHWESDSNISGITNPTEFDGHGDDNYGDNRGHDPESMTLASQESHLPTSTSNSDIVLDSITAEHEETRHKQQQAPEIISKRREPTRESRDFVDSGSGNCSTSAIVVPNKRQDAFPSALIKLALEFRQAMTVGTHTYHFKKYEKTFVGSEAVTFMVENGMAPTREDAVFMGQRLMQELQLFFHVCWDHTFKDGRYFYRFTDDSSLLTIASSGSTVASSEAAESVGISTLRTSDTSSSISSSQPHSASSTRSFSRRDLKKIAVLFQKNVIPGTHVYHFKRYKDTFVGREAVDYMVKSKMASSRKDAVFLGQRLLDLGLFSHVCNDHQFKDAFLFYRYCTEGGNTRAASETASWFKERVSLISGTSFTRSMSSFNIQDDHIPESKRISYSPDILSSSMRTTVQKSQSDQCLLPSNEHAEPGSIPRKLSHPGNIRSVTFDTIQERMYERILDVHPSTSSGPSVGLGWRYIEKPPERLAEKELGGANQRFCKRSTRGFQLSRETRLSMLRELGYSKKQLFQAARLNEKIREQRKQTLNKFTARTMADNRRSKSRPKVDRRLFRTN